MFDSIIEINSQLVTYMVVYNTSLVLFFSILFSTTITDIKYFTTIPSIISDVHNRVVFTVILLSMAGVPPFIGFFSKLFIISLVVNNSFFLFYWLVFGIVFLGLYFYMQNIRALHGLKTLYKKLPHVFFELFSLPHVYKVFIVMYFILFGLFFIEDTCEYVIWLII